jgi:hypothetical protein
MVHDEDTQRVAFRVAPADAVPVHGDAACRRRSVRRAAAIWAAVGGKVAVPMPL